jgi:hypothetical protein
MALRLVFGMLMIAGGLWISHMMRGAGDAVSGYDTPETLVYEMQRPAAEVFAIFREATQHPRVHEADTFVSDTLQISAVRGESIKYHMKVNDQENGIDVILAFQDSGSGKSVLRATVAVPTLPSGVAQSLYVSDEFITRKLDDALSELTAEINDGVAIESGAISVNHEIASVDARLRQWREQQAMQARQVPR